MLYSDFILHKSVFHYFMKNSNISQFQLCSIHPHSPMPIMESQPVIPLLRFSKFLESPRKYPMHSHAHSSIALFHSLCNCAGAIIMPEVHITVSLRARVTMRKSARIVYAPVSCPRVFSIFLPWGVVLLAAAILRSYNPFMRQRILIF